MNLPQRLETPVPRETSGKLLLTRQDDDIPIIPPEFFGKDHYSTLAYIECRCVDHDGKIALEKMRCNARRHRSLFGHKKKAPHLSKMRMGWNPKHGSIMKNGAVPFGEHDDWDCVEDMIACGWIEVEKWGVGSYVNDNPFSSGITLRLTEEGRRVCATLRAHKSDGGSFATFELEQL